MRAGEQALVEAIYEEPDDDAARAVYADWLQERGDPRGELIALQLARAAGTASEAGEARERALLDKHGKRWAGALDRWFEPQGRVFERGFLAGGVVTGVPRVFDPAWRLVRSLETRPGGDERLLDLMAAPELVSLRALHGLDEAVASTLASGPKLRLTELGFCARAHDEPPREHPLAVCRALPDLRVLAVEPRDDTGAWLAGAPVLGRLARLVIVFSAYRAPAPLVAALAGRRDLAAIELVDPAGPYLGSSGARALLRRGATALDALEIRVRPPARRTDFTIRRALVQVLEAAPAGLRSLAVDLGRAPKLAAEDRAAIDALVARFTRLEHASLPWSPAPERAAGSAPAAAMTLRAQGAAVLEVASLEALWARLGELGVTLDAMRAGTGVRPLGPRPVDKLRAWAANARARELALVHDGQPDELTLLRGREPADSIVYLRFVPRLPPRELAAWFARFAAGTGVRRATLYGADGRSRATPLRDVDCPDAGWLMYLGAHLETLLPAADVAALGDTLGGLFVIPAKRGYVLGVAATPGEVSARRLEAVEQALEQIAIAHLPAQLDYDLRARVAAVLGAVAKPLGLPATLDGAPFEPGFRKGGTPMRELVATLHDPLAAPRLEVTLARRDPDGYAREVLAEGPARTRGQLDKLLATAAKLARTQGEAFFAPKRAKARRR